MPNKFNIKSIQTQVVLSDLYYSAGDVNAALHNDAFSLSKHRTVHLGYPVTLAVLRITCDRPLHLFFLLLLLV